MQQAGEIIGLPEGVKACMQRSTTPARNCFWKLKNNKCVPPLPLLLPALPTLMPISCILIEPRCLCSSTAKNLQDGKFLHWLFVPSPAPLPPPCYVQAEGENWPDPQVGDLHGRKRPEQQAGEMCPLVLKRGSFGALLPAAALSPFWWAQPSIPIRRKQKHKHSGSSVQQSPDYSESSNVLIRALQPALASVTAQRRRQCSAPFNCHKPAAIWSPVPKEQTSLSLLVAQLCRNRRISKRSPLKTC